MRALRISLTAVAIASLLLLAGCAGTPSTPPAATGAAPAGSSAVSVSLKGMAIVPSDINVAAGGTVTFTNEDSVDHDIAGDSWDSGLMAPGATFSQVFATAGTFQIKCTIHPSMTGTVNVK
jgi:plastocyanin